MLDSWGKLGARLFKSSPLVMADYDECVNVRPESWNFTYAKYCSTSVEVKELSGIPLPVPSYQTGVCLPDTCEGPEAQAAINEFFATLPGTTFVYGGISCKPQVPMPLTDKAINTIIILSFFALFICIGTLYDVLIVRGYIYELMCQSQDDSDYDNVPMEEKKPLVEKKESSSPANEHKPGWVGKFFLSFSLRSNGATLLSTKVNPKTINCINGIRFYSMAWVVLGHHFSGAGNAKTNYGEYQAEKNQQWTFQALTNALVSVDSFFALSGLLMSYLVFKELDRTKPKQIPGFLGKFYFHRYWRLTPPYMLFMLAYVPLIKYMGDGPFWAYEGMEWKECEETWYYNLLYINNLQPYEKPMCMEWSWYLANDMQFFWVSPFIFMPMYYMRKYFKGILSQTWAFLWLLFNIIYVGVQSSTTEFGPNGGKDWHKDYYIKPWTRIGPYVVRVYFFEKVNSFHIICIVRNF